MYCISGYDWFALFVPWPHPHWKTFTETVINLKWNNESCITERSNSIHKVNVKKVICSADKFMQYGWVWKETIRQSIRNKNDSFALHELLWQIFFISKLTTSIVGHLKKWSSTWNQATKSCMDYLKSQSGQSTKCQMQFRWVFKENVQQSEIKMTHWYCISLSDLITFTCTLTSPILGDFYEGPPHSTFDSRIHDVS